VLATPLQLAAATAVIANGGTLYVPTLLKSRHQNEKNLEAPPKIMAHFDDTHEANATIKAAMQAVMQPGGTAWRAASNAAYPIAGKTGTAQVKSLSRGDRQKKHCLLNTRTMPYLLLSHQPIDQRSRWPSLSSMVVPEVALEAQ